MARNGVPFGARPGHSAGSNVTRGDVPGQCIITLMRPFIQGCGVHE